MTRWRQYLAFALCGVLVFTAQTLSSARATPPVAGQIVLCTGTGPLAVDVDASGTPIKRSHICPDCLLHYLAALAIDPPSAQPRRDRTGHVPVRIALRYPPLIPVSALARAPPRGV